MVRFAFVSPLGVVLLGAACSSPQSPAPSSATGGGAGASSGDTVLPPAAVVPAAGLQSPGRAPGEAPPTLAPPGAIFPMRWSGYGAATHPTEREDRVLNWTPHEQPRAFAPPGTMPLRAERRLRF
jgi:hypothetical protein